MFNLGYRFFNTAGPMIPEIHYQIPPLSRVNLPEILPLVQQGKYFVLHAPRQTGKTSCLMALRDLLNSGDAGRWRAVYVNVEVGQAGREDTARAMRAILGSLVTQARRTLDDPFPSSVWLAALENQGPDGALQELLTRWAAADPAPIVLMIDEIDSLVGDTLISMLRQLRAGYGERPGGYPYSVIVCGVRDVRDYRIHSTAEGTTVLGGSAFNIHAESLRLGDFTEAETRELLAQHTGETGQEFENRAIEAVWNLSQGQPWLVNSLAYHACFRDRAGRDRSHPIPASRIFEGKEEMILNQRTHVDQLAHKLREERVRRIVEPLLSGDLPEDGIRDDDLAYVRDLGLIAPDRPLRVANPIYREVIPRNLAYVIEQTLPHETAWFVDESGALRTGELLEAFQDFFRQHSEHWVDRFQYREAGPQLLLQAFLHRVVNAGGRIEREYGLGRMRTDLLIVWPRSGDVPDAARQRIVIECKVLRGSLERTVGEGLAQTRRYMDRCASAEGHLVLFDRSAERTWDERIFRREETVGGEPVTVWGM